MSKEQLRPIGHLHAAGAMYPQAWKQIEVFRDDKGKGLPDWPEWCFLPMAAWYSIVSADAGQNKLSPQLAGDVSKLAALGAWRYTQGIYRLDSDVYSAVSDTIPKGDLPTDVLLRMPEWSLYIETPGMEWLGSELHGFWAHLERDMNTQRNELRLLLDTDADLVPVPIHLGPWTITEAIDRSIDESKKQAALAGTKFEVPGELIEILSASTYSLVSLLLYVCSNGVEYNGNETPCYATPKKVKKGFKLFPAAKPRIWELGKKTGDSIRRAQTEAGNKKGPAPHIRRAHWHGFWTGPMDGDREFNLKWLAPIVVSGD